MANEEIHSRIRRARAVIAAGVRLKKPNLEAEGRADFAEACIENQIELYGTDLTPAQRSALIKAIHNIGIPKTPELTPEDIVNPKPVYTAPEPEEEEEESEDI